ncbi:uncharacterized protein LOC129569222 [Sitodiplosis mosellana]|uniref:uncharacterized protein LOC129569222 n=1 Tax=Sitodiplosis mosellana TaxID=263140 RepID=UPI002445361A|nr:uncharacterized protein LOC129569222 [Sitodiplosis mosellana]
MSSESITKLLHQVAKNQGFSDYEIKTKTGSNHGDNFVGVMTAITLSGTKGLNGNGARQELHLICKTPPADEARKKLLRSDLVFDREIYTYSKLLPAFVRFQQEQGLSEVDAFSSFPKVYASEAKNGSYILIMEDMKSKNYEMWPRENIIALDHELSIMRELGKFHACSFALKDQRPHEFDEFKGLKDIFIDVAIKGLFGSYIEKSVERAADTLKNPKYKEYMLNLRKNYASKVEHYLSEALSNDFGVIGHGDCWNNNFLFQNPDGDKNRLESVCFLDWQFVRFCSPAIDLLYNIFSSTDKEFRDQHYEKLLQTYYASLSKTIQRLGSDPNKLFSYEQLQAQLRKFGEIALLFAPMLMLVKLVKPEHIKPMGEYASGVERGEETDLINELDEETQAEFSRLVNELFSDLVGLGYIHLQ